LIDRLKQILSDHWGTNQFRPLQTEIITSVLTKNDTLALIPTGGGKSVCYQVPALYEEGMCLVISPLIALMKDQVEDLLNRHIPAAAVYSGMSFSEVENTLNNAIHKNYKVLYVSPERLQTESFKLKIPSLPIKFIAVDEAHCISEWGYDFRPAYLEIASIKEYLPKVPILALTATATNEVRKDIIEKLKLKDVQVFERSFNRDNLIYAIVQAESKYNSLLQISKNIAGSGIIYAKTRKEVQEIAYFLKIHKISADFYHAGLDNQTRSSKQEKWKKGKIRIMVSTNAFGMGIDKSDVRFVLHATIPESLEAYYQEAGRAGRDFKKSYAVVLTNKSDRTDLENRIESVFPTKNEIQTIYKALCSFLQIPPGSGADTEFDFNFQDFCNLYNLDLKKTANALQFLQRESLIFFPEKDSLPSRLMIVQSYMEIYNFQIVNAKYEILIKTLLRSYEGLFDLYIKINENEIAKRTGLQTQDVIRMLHELKNMEVVDYIPVKTKPQIVFLHDRVEKLELFHIYQNLEKRKIFYQKRIEWVIKYGFEHFGCRSKVLLGYFGEKLTKNCGHCDYCLKTADVGLSSEEFEIIYTELKKLLTEKKLSHEEIKTKISVFKENKIKTAIEWLVKQNVIIEDSNKLLELNR